MQPWQPQQPPQQPGWPSPQQLPGAIAPKTTEEHDLAALSPFLPKVAASLSAVGGLCAVLGSLQTWMTVEIEDLWFLVPIVDALFGVAVIGCAVRLATARRWASIAVLVACALLTVTSGVWAGFALTHGLYAVFIILAPPMCLVGTGLTAASIGACDRAEKARDRLASQGLELGL